MKVAKEITCVGWIRGSLTDSQGQWDIAYVSLFAVGITVIGAIPVMAMMTIIAYFRCAPMVVKEVLSVCTYDPAPLGTAIGMACGGFSTALLALAAYMAATRKHGYSDGDSATIPPLPKPSATPGGGDPGTKP